MKKLFIPLATLALSGLMGCSSDIDSVKAHRQVFTQQPVSEMTRLDQYIQKLFAAKYNVDISYRYDDKVTDRRYLLAPVMENKALEFLNLIDYLFFHCMHMCTHVCACVCACVFVPVCL